MTRKKVAGSPQFEMRVVAHRPSLIWGKRVALVCAACIIGGASYFIGFQTGARDLATTQASFDELAKNFSVAEETVALLESRVAAFDIKAEINTEVVGQLRERIVDLETQNTELNASNDFYKTLLQPGSDKLALRFDRLKVEFDGEAYSYRVNIRQFAVDHKLLKGSAAVKIKGYQGDEYITIDAANLGDAQSKDLRFRYYQELSGRLTLPVGFKPSEIMIEADVGKAAAVLNEAWPQHMIAVTSSE